MSTKIFVEKKNIFLALRSPPSSVGWTRAAEAPQELPAVKEINDPKQCKTDSAPRISGGPRRRRCLQRNRTGPAAERLRHAACPSEPRPVRRQEEDARHRRCAHRLPA